MSLSSSNIKLGSDVDPTVRRFQAAITRDLEQLYLLLGQGLGGFSNQSPGAISQDVTSNGMGVEANQGDYTFSGPASLDQLAQTVNNLSGFLQSVNNLSDVGSIPGAIYNLGVALAFGSYTKTTYSTPGSFTHTFAASSTRYIAIVAAGGGGGGGGSASAIIGAIGPRGGGGGGAGGACLVSSKVISASLSLTVGAAGTGGVTSGDGGDGGASTLTDGTTFVSPDPGSGGGGFGSNGGVGGAADAAIIGASTIVLGFNGGSGQPGSVYTISTIAGVVQSYQVTRGLPGRSSLLSFGAGGYGEAPGNPTGSAGGAGGIIIWEA